MKNKRRFKIVVLILIVIFSSICGVYAERVIASSKVTYSNGTSGLASNNVQGAIDELYGKYVRCFKSFGNFGCFLQSLEVGDTVIADDGTADHNMRYTGKSPNNYVTFNGELWRVIGVFNNVDNGTGVKETRVKIIKADSIGYKPWHPSNVNIWKSASLNAELQALSYASNNMIENAVWYLGDPGGLYNYATSQAYIYERGTKVASGNDLTWPGKVGLMYPSDYGFASSECKDVASTINDYGKCADSNWLCLGGAAEWVLSPNSDTTHAVRAVGSFGISHDSTSSSYVVRPTVYLKSDVICKNCNEVTAGTKENPFQLV